LINDEEVVPMDDIFIECIDKRKYKLVIRKCSLQDNKKTIKFIAKLCGNELSNSVKLRVQPAPPGLKLFSSVKEVYCVGDCVAFELSVKGHQEPYDVTWYKGFKRLSDEPDKVEMTTQKTFVSLLLTDLDCSDGGAYKCVIRSSLGTSEFKFSPIKIKEKIEYEKWKRIGGVVPPLSSNDISSKLEENVESFDGSVDDEIVDYNNNTQVDFTEKNETDVENVSCLVDTQQASFDESVSGDANGKSRLSGSHGIKDATRVDKTDGPLLSIREKLKPIVVECGDDATFTVALVGAVQKMVWFVNKVEVTNSSDRILITFDGDSKYSLILKNCCLDDNKTSVRFLATSTDEEEVSGSVRLKVQPAVPGLRIKTVTNEEYHVGDDIPFALSIRGHTEPFEIVWYNGFKSISPDDDRFEIVVGSSEVSLLVKNVGLSDAGTYKCVIKSSASTSEYKYEPIRIREKLFDSTHKISTDREKKLVRHLRDGVGEEHSNESFEDEEVIIPEVEKEVAAIPQSEAYSLSEHGVEGDRRGLLIPKKSMGDDGESGDNAVPFTIAEKMKPVVGECGESITLSVGLSKQPDKIKWYINNNEIDPSSNDYIIKNKDGICSVTILKCSMDDDKKALKYVAMCCGKELTSSIRLKIQPALPGVKQTSVLRDYYEEGELVRLEVEVKGHPEPYTVQWYKGFKVVSYVKSKYEFVKEKNIAAFILHDVQITDAGSYKCVVKSSTTSTELKFNSFKVKGLTTSISF